MSPILHISVCELWASPLALDQALSELQNWCEIVCTKSLLYEYGLRDSSYFQKIVLPISFLMFKGWQVGEKWKQACKEKGDGRWIVWNNTNQQNYCPYTLLLLLLRLLLLLLLLLRILTIPEGETIYSICQWNVYHYSSF